LAFNDKIWGRLHYDWRDYKGFGGGIDLEHNFLGSGSLSYYQVNEHLRYRGEISPFYEVHAINWSIGINGI